MYNSNVGVRNDPKALREGALTELIILVGLQLFVEPANLKKARMTNNKVTRRDV
jgi:hypothetical protein